MGIFVNALREETEFLDNTGFDAGAVTDPDDKYEVELNDVAKAVEDINQNYADQSSQEELDGQDLDSNPVEECMISIYESEHNWNLIMNTLAMREVHEAAMGREVVMESVDIKGFFEKVKQFFVKMWKKITAVVQQWISNVAVVLKTNKQFMNKYGKDLQKGYDAYYADSGYKNFKGYKFSSALDKAAMIGLFNGMKVADETQQSVNKLITAIKSGLHSHGTVGSYAAEDKYDPDKVRGGFVGENSVTAGDFTKTLKEKWFGSENKETLSKNDACLSVDFISSVLKSDMKMTDVRKAYNDMKKSFNTLLKSLGDLEKAINGSHKEGKADEETSNAITNVSKWSSNVKECKNAAHIALTTFMRCSHARTAQCRRIANAYMFALNKKTRKGKFDAADGKKVSESAGFFSNLEMI